MRITAKDLSELGLVDEIVAEPLGGAHNDLPEMAQTLKTALIANLEALKKNSGGERLKKRYQKYRAYGRVLETQKKAAGLENGETSGNGEHALGAS